MSKEYDLQVLVLGRTKVGKSTIAHFIKQKLQEIGFVCDVSDLDFPGQGIEDSQHMADKMQILGEKNTKILIETKQVRKEGLFGKD